MSIFLIRHGETVGNASRVVQHPDNPLSPRGVAQAERLARRLAGAGIAHIVSSDFARAAGTARALERVLAVPLTFEPLLQERSFGDLRGTPYADLGLDMFAPDYAPPNGETWDVFHRRVDRAWARVQAVAAQLAFLAILRSASSIRDCQPGPLDLKCFTTSGLRRIETATLVGAFCCPRVPLN